MSKVAIYEPDYDTRETLKFVLESEDHEIIASGDAHELLKLITEKQTDIVLAAFESSAIDPARRDGLWLCDELKKLRVTHKIPVVMIGHIGADKTRAFVQRYLQRRHGAIDFLQKPFNPDVMIQAVNDILLGLTAKRWPLH